MGETIEGCRPEGDAQWTDGWHILKRDGILQVAKWHAIREEWHDLRENGLWPVYADEVQRAGWVYVRQVDPEEAIHMLVLEVSALREAATNGGWIPIPDPPQPGVAPFDGQTVLVARMGQFGRQIIRTAEYEEGIWWSAGMIFRDPTHYQTIAPLLPPTAGEGG